MESDSELLDFGDDTKSTRQLFLPQRSKVSNRTRLVIGIDFGTTFSGASFALLHPKDDPAEAKISVVRNWKGDLPGNTTSNKVPTEIAYGTDGDIYWGFDIPEELRENTYKWLKLLLEPEVSTKLAWTDAVSPKVTDLLLKRENREAVQVAADYVRLLWGHVKSQIINEHSKATYDFAEKSIVFTVPAVWSEAAKHNTYLVAVGAGLASEDLSLQTISEPEAAGIAVLKERGSLLKDGDCYIVVDAGGGTVDLTSYLLTSTTPIRLEELMAGDGDVCGAVFLQMNFAKLLRNYLGATVFDSLPTENVDGIMNDFEGGVRKVFDGEERSYKVAMPGVSPAACSKIKAGYLRLSADDLLTVFTPVISKVEKLVERQVTTLRAMKKDPKAILLVGGFGMNRYLAKRLKDTYEVRSSEKDSIIEVLQPNIGWESIANGAVRCEAMGIGNILSFRIARFNVGIVYHEGFNPLVDTPEQRYTSEFDGAQMAKDKVKWYLNKGERIKPGEQIDFALNAELYDPAPRTSPLKDYIHLTFVQSSEDDAPPRKTKRTKHFVALDFPWDLVAHPRTTYRRRLSQSGNPYRQVPIVVHMRQGPAQMEFSYSVGGVQRGPALTAEFRDLSLHAGAGGEGDEEDDDLEGEWGDEEDEEEEDGKTLWEGVDGS